MSNDLSGRVGLDTTDFKSGLAGMNRELRVLESSFRASAAGLGDWAKDATGLEMRIKSLNGQIDVQKNKVAALEGEYKRVAAEKGENSRAAQELQIKLNKETETLGKMESELGKTEKALSEMGSETGKASKETDKLEKEEGQATGATNKFAAALNGLKDKLNAGVGGLGKMVTGVGKLAAGMAVGLAAGAAGAAVGIGALVVKTAAASDELVETAEKMGITTTRLQELNYIADQTGTGVDTMQGALSRMTRSLDDVEKEGTPAQAAFQKLGVSVKDSSGQLRDNKDILFESIAALGSVENATERDALAMELFGKSAMELNPLINLGAEGMAAMAGEAHALGAVMSEESVAGMAGLNDAIAGLKAGFGGLAGELATAFLPMIQGVIGYIQETVIPWLSENLPAAIQVLSDFWSGTLQPAIAGVWAWMSGTLIPFLQNTVAPWLQEVIPAAIQVLSDFWTGVLQPAITAVWAWMSGTLMPFLQTTVFPWLKTHIPQALQVLSNFWTSVLQPAITAVWSWMSGTLIPFLQNTVYPWLATNIPAAIQVLSDFWNNVLLPAITAVWDFISTYIVPIFETLQSIFKTVMTLAITILAGAFTNVLVPAFSKVWEFLDTKLSPAFKWFKDKIIDPLATSLKTGLETALTWVYNTLVKLKGLFDTIKIPDWLVPGSPTPLEMGIRGINDALREMSEYSLPAVSKGFGKLSLAGAANAGSTVNNWNLTINEAGGRGNVMQDFALLRALSRS